jgi:hypothetical protein
MIKWSIMSKKESIKMLKDAELSGNIVRINSKLSKLMKSIPGIREKEIK